MSRRAIFSAKEVLHMVFDSDSDSDDGEMDDGSDMELDVSCYFTILSKNKLARLRGSSTSIDLAGMPVSRPEPEAAEFRVDSCHRDLFSTWIM